MSRRNRRQAFHRLGPLLALAIALVAVVAGSALGPTVSAAAPQEASAQYGKDPGAGLDIFTTVPEGTFFDFRGEFALPAGFFEKGSARYEGRVPFKGVPLRTFRGQKVGNGDTVVSRKSMPKLGPPFPSRGTARIELVALSLASAEPLKVQVGDRTELWDARLQLSKKQPPAGKMTIVQTDERGGTFDSEFRVSPVLTFTQRGGKAQRVLDVGAMRLSQEGVQRMTLRATAVPWSTQAVKNAVIQGSRFNPGVQAGAAINIQHHNHDIIIATLPDPGV